MMKSNMNTEELLKLLDELGIEYHYYEHGRMETMEDSIEFNAKLNCVVCKNCFVKKRKGNEFFMILMPYQKRFVAKEYVALGYPKCEFAKSEDMERLLSIPEGVTPLALINDKNNEVRLLIDDEYKDLDYMCMHPLRCDATVHINFQDFVNKFLPYAHHEPEFIKILGE